MGLSLVSGSGEYDLEERRNDRVESVFKVDRAYFD